MGHLPVAGVTMATRRTSAFITIRAPNNTVLHTPRVSFDGNSAFNKGITVRSTTGNCYKLVT